MGSINPSSTVINHQGFSSHWTVEFSSLVPHPLVPSRKKWAKQCDRRAVATPTSPCRFHSRRRVDFWCISTRWLRMTSEARHGSGWTGSTWWPCNFNGVLEKHPLSNWGCPVYCICVGIYIYIHTSIDGLYLLFFRCLFIQMVIHQRARVRTSATTRFWHCRMVPSSCVCCLISPLTSIHCN